MPEPEATRWFTVPAPIRSLFQSFPLHIYPSNDLPTRSHSGTKYHSLYIFASDEDAARGRPSFNPSCLKWQTYLKICGVEIELVSSNNHASPSGSLPFLLPAETCKAQLPVTTSKLYRWAADNGRTQVEEVSSPRLEAYQSLLDHRIRNAWLYSLYLSRPNTQLLVDLYIRPASASRVVQKTLLHQVRNAAETEILKSTRISFVDADRLYEDAKTALEALATLLHEAEWFFESKAPTLFDAAVFSYTHLLLDQRLQWGDSRLGEMLRAIPVLMRHRDRLLDLYWTPDESVA